MTEIGRTPRHKTSHQDAGADEIDATGLAGRCDLVDRGDPDASDFAIGDLTIDGTWRDLDLSSVVPVGAKAVLLRVWVNSGAVASSFGLRKKGNSNTSNAGFINTQEAAVWNFTDTVVSVDSNRKIQYNAEDVSWVGIYITIACWWI